MKFVAFLRVGLPLFLIGFSPLGYADEKTAGCISGVEIHKMSEVGGPVCVGCDEDSLGYGEGEGYSSKEHKAENIWRVAAYDFGSGGVRVVVSDIDVEKDYVVKELYKKREMWDFDLHEENYHERLSLIQRLEREIEFEHGRGKIVRHHAVATAGFRQAGEVGELLAEEIDKTTRIDLKIIDQDIEGLLAFHGIGLEVDDFNPDKDIVWDVGGGSMQISYYDEAGIFRVVGVRLGGKFFLKIVKELLIEGKLSDVESVGAKLLREKVTEKDVKSIKNKIAEGGKIYGVGALVKTSKNLQKLLGTDTVGHGLRKKPVEVAIYYMLSVDEDKVQDLLGRGREDGYLLSLVLFVLAKTSMEVLEIDEVQALQDSFFINARGVLAKLMQDN